MENKISMVNNVYDLAKVFQFDESENLVEEDVIQVLNILFKCRNKNLKIIKENEGIIFCSINESIKSPKLTYPIAQKDIDEWIEKIQIIEA